MRALWFALVGNDPVVIAYAVYIIACIFVGSWHIGWAATRAVAAVGRALREML